MTKVGAQAIRRLFGEVVCSVAAVTDAGHAGTGGLMDPSPRRRGRAAGHAPPPLMSRCATCLNCVRRAPGAMHVRWTATWPTSWPAGADVGAEPPSMNGIEYVPMVRYERTQGKGRTEPVGRYKTERFCTKKADRRFTSWSWPSCRSTFAGSPTCIRRAGRVQVFSIDHQSQLATRSWNLRRCHRRHTREAGRVAGMRPGRHRTVHSDCAELDAST